MSIPGAASPLFLATTAGAAAGFEISRSLRFNSGDSAYLNRTPSSAGNRKTWTLSFWIKRVKFGGYTPLLDARNPLNDSLISLLFNSNDELELGHYSFSSIKTSRKYRDPSSWYHIVLAVDTTQGTASNRIKVYTNGVQEDSFTTSSYPSQNTEYNWNTASLHTINQASSSYGDQYFADVHCIDGQALAPTDFGETDDNGVWQPKEFAGTYGPLVDQSQTWSGMLTAETTGNVSNPTYAFDGTPGNTSSTSARTSPTSTQGGIIFTPTNGYTVLSKVEVYGGSDSDECFIDFGSGYGSAVSLTSGAWNTVYTGSGTITYIKVKDPNGSNASGLGGIRIDGKLLIDAGVSVADNSFRLSFADNSSDAALGTDSSGNSNTWSVNNLTAASAALYGVSFDGSGDKLKVTDDASLAFGTGEFTVEMYFIADTVSGNDVLYDSRANTGNPSDGFSIVRNGNQLRTYTSGAYKVTSSTTLSTGQLYHLAVTREGTTQKMYLDGTLVGSTTVNNNFSQQKATIGSDVNGDESWDGFISNVRLVKGTAVYTANFTAPTANLTNITNTVLLCCQSDTSTTAATVSPGTITASGNVAVMSHSSTSVTDIDSLVDSPTNGTQTDTGAGGEVVGNYCTWNPNAGLNETLTNGNLECSLSAGSYSKARATIGVSSGKYYWEIQFKSGGFGMIGISDASLGGTSINYAIGGLYYYVASGGLYGNVGGSFSNTSYGSALSADDILGIALDMDNGNVKFYKNGSDLGTANTSSLVGKTIMPHLGEASGATFVTVANFGQRAFAHPVSGYKCLNTASLPEPTIADGSKYFDTKLYDGNSGTNAITMPNSNLSPDFVWLKARNAAYGHNLYDSIRGALNTLNTNGTFAAYNEANSLTSFDSNGFTLGSSAGLNQSGKTFAAWVWDGGSSTVSNTDGSITSNVRAQPSAGFSCVSYTGTGSALTVGHGLNAAPEFLIVKNRTSAASWFVYHKSIGATKYLKLETTSAEATGALWNNTEPTSSVVSSSGASTGSSGQDYLMLAFAPVEGYSAMGSYQGNGNASGPFVYTGFRPALVLRKSSSSNISDWTIMDQERDPINQTSNILRPNLTNAEVADQYSYMDILSNGFKARSSGSYGNNVSGTTYIYIAFASNPFASNGGLAR